LKSPLKQDIFNHELASQSLGPALVQYYIDIETTGASTQFYDKFNGRFYVAQVMRHIWNLESYKQSFERVFLDTDLFLRFTNMLMNDSIYLLDETFTKLHTIHENEELFATPQWIARGMARQEREVEHVQLERMVKTYLMLSRETVRMFQYITRDMSKYFIRPELVDRVAAMLNYFLAQLAGPKYNALKVRNPQRYNYQPDWLLKKIAQTYINFIQYEEFASAVVRDGRSYSSDVFRASGERINNIDNVKQNIKDQFGQFLRKVDLKAKEEAAKQEILGEIPDEFLDPILQTLMVDPVKLPTSNMTMDRATITRHLLSTASDPFNREALTVEDLVPDVELKGKIDQWLSKKKQ